MRRRLILSIAAVAAGSVVLLAVPLGIVLGHSYRDQEFLRLQRDAVAATRAIDLSPGRTDPVELPRSPALLTVYDRLGRRVAGQGPSRAPGVVRQALDRGRPSNAVGPGVFEVAVPIVNAERVTGALRAVRPDAAAVDRARSAWLVLGAIALGIVVIAVLAALVLGRRLAAPLERLAISARRLGDGDFSVRAPRAGIAEVDAVGAALNATAERLDDLITRERSFTADASHQLRTPLQALRIELEAIGLRPGEPPEVPAALAQVDRLQATIDTLLAVARDIPRSGAVADVSQVLDDAEARWRGPLATRGRPLRIRIETEPGRVQASAPVISEVLDILIGNADRHGRGAVTIVATAGERFVSIDVGDDGPGFAGDPEAAFARRSGVDNGHGIGLSLARSLAHAEGGRLTVTRGGPRPVLRLMLPR